MKKKFLTQIIVFSLAFIFSFDGCKKTPKTENTDIFSSQEKIITMQSNFSSKNEITIKWKIEKNYGIKIKAFNTISLFKKNSTSAELKKIPIQYSLTGIVSKKYNEYYETLNDTIVSSPKINNTKEYIIKSTIYFCSFEQGYCSVQKLSQSIKK